MKMAAVKSSYRNASGENFAVLFMPPRNAGFGDSWKYIYRARDAQNVTRNYRVTIARAHIPKEEDARVFAQGSEVVASLHKLLDEPDGGHAPVPDMSKGWAVYRS